MLPGLETLAYCGFYSNRKRSFASRIWASLGPPTFALHETGKPWTLGIWRRRAMCLKRVSLTFLGDLKNREGPCGASQDRKGKGLLHID